MAVIKLLKMIGGGGMANVYLAHDMILGPRCCGKNITTRFFK